MNRPGLVEFFLMVAVLWPSAAPAQSESPVQMAIRTDAAQFTKGAEIKLWITLTNVSDHPIDIYTASGANGGRAEYDDAIDVRDASGQLLPRIDGRTVVRSDGRVIKMPVQPPSRRGVVLQPGEKFHDYTILNRLFDLRRPGTYAVSAANAVRLDHASPKPKLTTSRSDTISVTIADSEGTR